MRIIQCWRTRGKIAVMAAIAVAVAITVASCTSGSSASSALPDLSQGVAASQRAAGGAAEFGSSGAAGQSMATDSAGRPAAAGGQSGANAAPGAGQSAVPLGGGKIIRTAELAVRLRVEPAQGTDDVAADQQADAAARSAAVAQAGATVRGIAIAAGGFQASADGGGSQTTVSLRVPVDQYDAVLDKLTAVGEVTARSESSQDVTGQVADVNSRVDSMTASVARVRALLAQAGTIADVISIESELSVREANLESLQQQQAALSGQVAMSTISLSLVAVTNDRQTAEPAAQDSGFIAGLNAGWAALVGFAGWVGGAVGAVLPFLPLLAAAVLLLWWWRRRTRPSGATAAPGAPAPGSAAEMGRTTDASPAETAGVGSN